MLMGKVSGIPALAVLYIDESLLVAHAVLVRTTQRRLRPSAGEADGGLRPLSLYIRSAPGAHPCDPEAGRYLKPLVLR
jgi:hypothetical protein